MKNINENYKLVNNIKIKLVQNKNVSKGRQNLNV